MSASPPRWEFRTWFAPGEPIGGPFEGWTAKDTTQRTDVYLILPGAHGLLPKLRGNTRLDVKQRIALDDPLQQWRVAFGADFPLADDDLDEALGLLARPGLRPAADAGLDGERFLAALREHVPGLLERTVTKRRTSFVRDVVIGERTAVEVAEDGSHAVSIALESTDPDALRTAMTVSGLEDRPNVDYGAWLKAGAGAAGD
ncbi:hypothetical protein [Amorphus coralli]|uniref:hypothetical protein n=1 Tax=Amorphus coralli TaxID=340680 RepID=UPI000379D17A|nr:hypothetical protein [Amorphus coralli]